MATQDDANSKSTVKDSDSASIPTASERQDDGIDKYRPLYDAILKGDCRSAEIFLKEHPDGLTARISHSLEATALNIAAMEGHSRIVEKLVQVMPLEAMASLDVSQYRALENAIVDGNIESVKAILRKDPDMAQRTCDGITSLDLALVFATGEEDTPNHKRKPRSKKAIWLLSVVMKDETFSRIEVIKPCEFLIDAGYFDICLHLLKRYPNVTSEKERVCRLLQSLAQCSSHFPSGSRLGFWESCIYSFVPVHLRKTPQYWLRKEVELMNIPDSAHLFRITSRANLFIEALYAIRRIIWKIFACLVPSLKYIRYEKKKNMYAVELTNFLLKQLSHKGYVDPKSMQIRLSLALATENGIVEIVKAFYCHFPDMLWHWKSAILQFAIEHRRHQIFSLFNKNNGRNKLQFMRLKNATDLYYLVAKLSPAPQLSSVSGPAFQMQRELQWFKEVEKFISPLERNRKRDGKSAWEVFLEEHKDLRDKAEKWMKDTSNFCMVVAALIATMAFAAAFTVPGGNDSNGVAILIRRKSFTVFAVFNALAFFSSVTSILMFLSILNSRYAVEDFQESLPKRVIAGLAYLFVAIATMLIAFGAALSIVLGKRWKWDFIPITLLASSPIAMFGILQLPLFIRMLHTTYGSGVFRPQVIW